MKTTADTLTSILPAEWGDVKPAPAERDQLSRAMLIMVAAVVRTHRGDNPIMAGDLRLNEL
jgi:hypothetical protein